MPILASDFAKRNEFGNLGEKIIPKNSHMSRLLKKNKYFIYPTSVAMVTHRRTIDRADFALFGIFLAISGHIFEF